MPRKATTHSNDVLLELQNMNRRLAALEELIVQSNEVVLDVDGVAELLGCSRWGVYQWTRIPKGQTAPALPHFKRGKRLYFRRSDVIAWMTTYRIESQSEMEATAQDYVARHPLTTRPTRTRRAKE